jgi:hypothetical protein
VLYQKHFQAAGGSDHDETQKVFSHRIPTELSFPTKLCHSVLIHSEPSVRLNLFTVWKLCFVYIVPLSSGLLRLSPETSV